MPTKHLKLEESGTWQSILGQRISQSMTELGENLTSVTTNNVMKTERDLLRQRVAHLEAKVDTIVAQTL